MVTKAIMHKRNHFSLGEFDLKPTVAGVRLAIGGLLAGAMALPVQAELPVAAQNWVGSGAADKAINGNTMNITQHTDKAVLNWQSFNIGVDNRVDFAQPGSNSVALNRIGQSDPSRILGTLTANGQIYLVNKNGFIFGEHAVIDVNSLIASTHDISDDVFERGIARIFDDNEGAAFMLDDPTVAGNTEELKKILIEAGAKITSGDNGNILIVAPEIDNHGDLQTGNFGQIMLVASQDKVYLQQADSDDFNGLLVEVDTGGKVSNFGNLLAKQGNITMAGFMVNQAGRVNATTSVTVNGSVRLQAREGHSKEGAQLIGVSTTRSSDRGDGLGTEATVTLAENSLTTLTPDTARGKAIDEQDQPPSYLEISAHTIELKPDSRIVAPGAKVDITATSNLKDPTNINATGRFVAESGSVIDVSGLDGVDVAMERNVGEIDARSSFVLRDSPNQRGGVLFGESLLVDLRRDTEIVDVEGAKSRIERSIFERMTKGGAIKLTASGEAVVANGVLIDIAGGSVDYQGGMITTTQLVNEAGQQFDISDADPNDHFVDFFNQERFEPGYSEGKDAGSFRIETAGLTWEGALDASVSNGIRQRTPETMAKGGSFSVDMAVFQSVQSLSFQHGNALSQLALSGLNDFTLKTFGDVTIDRNVNLAFAPLTNIMLDAGSLNVEGKIYSAGGNVSLNGLRNPALDTTGDVVLADGSLIDVSGRWVNDRLTLLTGRSPSEAIVIDGGSANVTAQGDLIAEQGAAIRADGGAHYAANRTLASGKGGDIELSALGVPVRPALLSLNASLSARALEENGSLALAGNEIVIGDRNGSDEAGRVTYLAADNELFSGFSDISINAEYGNLSLTDTASIRLFQRNRQLLIGFDSRQSGRSMSGFTRLTSLPDYFRSASDLRLSAKQNIKMGQGSSIFAENESTVSLMAEGSIFVDGTISAPAGEIALTVKAPEGSGFDPTQTLWLGEHARLLARGAVEVDPLSLLRTGQVMAGGTIGLTAQRGYIVVENGALMDVSGTADTLYVAVNGSPSFGYRRSLIGSDAGTIQLTAAEGMALDGSFVGKGGTSTNRNGALAIELDRSNRNLPDDPDIAKLFPNNPLTIGVAQAAENVSETIEFGDSLHPLLSGKADLSLENLAQGDFDFIRLTTPDQIQFTGDVTLSAGVEVMMDADVIGWQALPGVSGGTVTVQAPYLSIGSSINLTVAGTPQTGEGIFNMEGDWVDLFGALKLDNFQQVNIVSRNDIRARANHFANNNDFTGELVTAGDLNLTASKIYPSSLSKFRFAVANNSEGTINVFGTSGNSAAPLSAGGELTLQAAHINQAGTLVAPFGLITLDAEQSLTLADGSLTSVSGDGLLVPLGNVVDGLDWIYPLALGISPSQSSGNLLIRASENAKLDKQVLLSAPEIVQTENAVIDLTGGGDIFAYEFIPGIGGSYDYLQPGSPSYNGSFAVMPGLGTTYAPYDHFQSHDFDFTAGETVVLNNGGGIPAGEYVKLPAHYALLPGTFLVTPVAGTQDQGVTTATLDGRRIVSGYSNIAGTGKRDARNSGFMIENGAQVRKQSQYDTYTGDEFFIHQAATNETRIPLLARDGGLVSIQAQTRLLLEGLFNIDAPGIGARMDIAANNIHVTDQLSAVPEDGVLEILADNLSNLNIASLLLGGERQIGAADGETVINVGSESIVFEADSMLDVADLIVAAKDSITVKQGAIISSSGRVDSGDKLLTVDGDGALLRVSGAEQVDLNRVNANGDRGRLLVEEGALLKAERSMLLGSSQSTKIAGDILMERGSLNLATNRINIGELEGQNDNDALNLSNAVLDRLAVDELVLTSRDAINFYGSTGKLDANGLLQHVTGGIAPLEISRLVINAAGLSGQAVDADGASNSVNLEVGELELKNTLNVIASLPPTGAGTLNIEADKISTGDGQFTVDGFDSVNLTANEQFKAEGEGSMIVAADLNLTTPLLTAGSKGDYYLDARGYQAEFNSQGPAQSLNNDLTGRLAITADQVALNTHVDLASGAFDLTALTGDIRLGEQAQVDLSGRRFDFADVSMYTEGGNFSAKAESGNVRFAEGSSINLDGGDGNQSGGLLKLTANEGSAYLNGDFSANGGSVDIDVAGFESQEEFNRLFGKLAAAGATKSIDYVSGRNDINVTSGTEIIAEHVKLTADRGSVAVAGRIDADAQQDGSIELLAKNEVVLEQGAELTARTQTTGKGGSVLLSTIDPMQGGIVIRQGSTIDVGNAQGEKGRVTLRAPRVDSNNDGVDDNLNIVQVAGTISGYQGNGFFAEGIKVYQDDNGSVSAADINAYRADAAAFMQAEHRTAIRDRLHQDLMLRPVIEAQYDGDLTLASSLNTVDWRYAPLDGSGDAEVGELILRASGDLNLNNTVSDGFSTKLLAANSWSFAFTSGADLNSADSNAVNGPGDINIGGGVIIRTGNGNIAMHAGGDVNFTDQTSVVYNMGRQDAASPYGNLSRSPAYEFPIDGGDIEIIAEGDVNGAVSDQFINEWLVRNDRDGRSFKTSWGVELKTPKFQQNIGSFGGGGVNVQAKGDIKDLSIMMPTTGKWISDDVIEVNGGGTMQVNAGGSIYGGAYFNGKGQAEISAGKSIAGGSQFTDGPVLALGGAQVALRAGDDLMLTSISDPMLLSSKVNFFGYSENSALSAYSLSGNIYLGADDEKIRGLMGYNSTQSDLAKVYPGTLNAIATGGSIFVKDNITLFPSAVGQLNLLARDEIRPLQTGSEKLNIGMSDADPSLLTAATSPVTANGLGNDRDRLTPFTQSQPLLIHKATPLHVGDHEPVRFITKLGDIQQFQINLPKKAVFESGRDVTKLKLHIQHVNEGDYSIINAARDFKSDSGRDQVTGAKAPNNDLLEVAGPGDVFIRTGRNLDLGRSGGITTVGNVFNPALPEHGANLNILVGASEQPDYLNFIQQLNEFAHLNAGNELASNELFAAVSRIDMDEAAQWDQVTMERSIMPLFYEALKAGGVAESTGNTLGNALGFTAIESLFPGNGWNGDLKMIFSLVQTQAGGDINFAVPGGGINVGAAVAEQGNFDEREPGIIALLDGAVNIFLKDDLEVNQSRVFALGGDDILVWSSDGDIDAGRGAKSAISAPPPEIQINPVTGATEPKFPPIVSGKGIRTAAPEGKEAGDVFLFAPRGVINAGEAGIGGNNITLVAKAVLGANNIDVGGTSVGVPTQTASVSPVAGVSSNSTANVSKAAEKTVSNGTSDASEDKVALGMLSVEVVGFGFADDSDDEDDKKKSDS